MSAKETSHYHFDIAAKDTSCGLGPSIVSGFGSVRRFRSAALAAQTLLLHNLIN